MDIEIRRGLCEARALAGEHRGVLAAYAALGVLLPYLLLSSEPIFSLRTVMAIVSDPWTYRVGGSIAGPLYLLGIVAVIVTGTLLATWNALLAQIREGYVSEIMFGMVAGAAFLFANIILYVGLGLLVTLPLIAFVGATPEPGTATNIAVELYRFAISMLGSWIGARLCLTGPIMAGRGGLEPVSAMIESWRRTRSAQWRLLGTYFLFDLVFVIAFVALAALHGAIIVRNAPGSLAEMAMSLGWVLLFAGYFLGKVLLAAGFHRVSRPETGAAEVFA